MHRVVDKGEFVRSFSGSNRYILDYLFDEVLDRLSRNLQEFLLKTSILDRLCGSLCDAVTGRQDSYRMLQRVEAANLFIIPLDETRTWYRYHRLFADLLRHRLRISGEISEEDLHRRACNWYEENGYPKQAIHSALHCQDWERAIELILQNGDYMLRQGEVATLLSLYNKLPEAEINARPDLCLRYSWPLLLTGQLNEAEAYLNQAELIAPNDPSILRELTIARAFIARSRGHDQMTIDLSRQALEFVPEIDASLQSVLSVNLGIANWHRGELNQANEAFHMASTALVRTDNRYARLTTLIFQNRIKAARGQLTAAYEGYLPLVENESPMPILALAYLDLGVLYYEWNRLEQSIEWIKKCISHSEWTRNAEFQVAGHTQFARIRLELGDISAAINALQKADTLIEQHSILPLNQSRNAAIHVQLALAQGDLQRAAVWLEEAGENADPHNFYPFLGLAPARFYLAQRLNQEAGIYLDGCLTRAIQAGCGYGEVAVRVMRSLVEENRQKALEILLPALRLGQQEGFIRSFVQGGTPLLPFLNQAVLQGIEPVYVGRINSAIRNSAADGLAGGAKDVEALSEREIEVLRLLEVGLSNQEIADQLAISLGTVKTHVHHVYGKLGVSNRTAACKVGREAGYIT
jgi:LuxR family maltose regulon positive regulatory protein